MIEPGCLDELQSNVTPRRPNFVRLSHDKQLRVKQMASRIKFLIEALGEDRSMRMKEIKRGLHSYRYLEFDEAMKLLEQSGQIVIRRVPSRGLVLRVTLKYSRKKLPDPFVFVHRRKRKKRKPTTWFLERRHLFDAGHHEGFAKTEPWHESAFWIEKEKMLEDEDGLD